MKNKAGTDFFLAHTVDSCSDIHVTQSENYLLYHASPQKKLPLEEQIQEGRLSTHHPFKVKMTK